MENNKLIHVAVAVIRDEYDNVLLSKRHAHVHQGGLWEFPGGKLDTGESARDALKRELQEELGIQITQYAPLIQLTHHYAELSVCLYVYEVSAYTGNAQSCEGQEISWHKISTLQQLPFPQANYAIIKALHLPHRYAILNGGCAETLYQQLSHSQQQGIRLMQLRQKQLSACEMKQFFDLAAALIVKNQLHIMINSAMLQDKTFSAQAVHLTATDLLGLAKRPGQTRLLSASCHNLRELQHAEQINVDFAVLSPVKKTASHPQLSAQGWPWFAELVAQVNIPVYALGGMQTEDELIARQHGGQGIAAIRLFNGGD